MSLTREQIEEIKDDIRNGRPVGVTRCIALCDLALSSAVRQEGVWPVMDEIREELTKAVTKFPTWPTDPLHAVAVLGEEYGELVKDVLQFTYESHKTTRENVRKEAIQCAAMAIRFAQSLSLYDYAPGKQHKQKAAPSAEGR